MSGFQRPEEKPLGHEQCEIDVCVFCVGCHYKTKPECVDCGVSLKAIEVRDIGTQADCVSDEREADLTRRYIYVEKREEDEDDMVIVPPASTVPEASTETPAPNEQADTQESLITTDSTNLIGAMKTLVIGSDKS